MIHHIKNGSAIRLMFKIGRLATRNGEINWKSLVEMEDKNQNKDDNFSKFSATMS